MALDRTLISIRERRQVDLFDLALVVIRRRLRPLAVAAACGIAPFVLLNAWAFNHLGGAGPGISLFLWWIEAPIASAPLTLVLGGLMFDRRASTRSIARELAASSGTLALTHCLLRYLPVYWLPPRLMFANEVVLLEKGGWSTLWKRGSNLSGGREADLVVLSMAQFGATLVFATFGYLGLGRMLQSLTAETLTWDLPESTILTTLAFQVPIWVGVAYFTVVRFLTYIDQRIRLEGWEVELRVRAAGEALAEARRW